MCSTHCVLSNGKLIGWLASDHFVSISLDSKVWTLKLKVQTDRIVWKLKESKPSLWVKLINNCDCFSSLRGRTTLVFGDRLVFELLRCPVEPAPKWTHEWFLRISYTRITQFLFTCQALNRIDFFIKNLFVELWTLSMYYFVLILKSFNLFHHLSLNFES